MVDKFIFFTGYLCPFHSSSLSAASDDIFSRISIAIAFSRVVLARFANCFAFISIIFLFFGERAIMLLLADAGVRVEEVVMLLLYITIASC